MKIALVSSHPETLAQMREQAAPLTEGDELLEYAESLAQSHVLVRRERPLVVVMQMERPDEEWPLIEALSADRPDLHLILLQSADRTPDFLLRAMQAGAREVLQLPLDPLQLRQALERVIRRVEQARTPERKAEVHSFMSVKGGAGATFLAANLAHILATEFDKNVILLDLNLPFGESETYLTRDTPQYSLCDVTEKAAQLDESMLNAALLRVHPRLGVLSSADQPERSVSIMAEQVGIMIDVAAGMADFVFVDISAALNGVSLAALDRSTRILPVMEATFPMVRNGKRIVEMFRRLGYAPEKITPILNRFDGAGPISLADVEKTIGLPVVYKMPAREDVARSCTNQGVPLATLGPRDPLTRQLRGMAEQYARTDSGQGGEKSESRLGGGLRQALRRLVN